MKSSRIEGKQTELLLSHERDRAQWEQRQTDFTHQRDDYKSEVERLKAREDSYVKEIEKLRYEARNARKNAFRAQQNTDSNMGGMVGASILGKMNLGIPGGGGGYKPGQYASKAADGGADTDRSFSTRYGGIKDISASVDVGSSKFGSALAQKMQMQGMPGTNEFATGVNTVENSDHSSHHKPNVFSTPSSSKKSDAEDMDIPNTE